MGAEKGLSPRYRIFVKEYLKDKNGARALRAAGFSPRGADQAASRLLRNVKVAQAIEKGLARLETRLELSAERNLQRIAEMAYHTPRARPTDVLKACELLGKHFKQFTESHEISGKDGGPQIIAYIPDNGRRESEEKK